MRFERVPRAFTMLAIACLGLVGSLYLSSAWRSDVLVSLTSVALAGRPVTQLTEVKETNFYVSTDGSDTWSGRLAKPNSTDTDGPLRTLARARDAVREMKARGTLSLPITVYVRGGRYDLAAPLVFAPEDSGTNQAPVTYAAYQGEEPVVSGGREVHGWKPATGAALPLADHGVWMAEVPEVKEGKWYFRELFVNGSRRQRARSPNTGFFRVEGKVSAGNPAQFRYREGDIRPEWASEGDVEVVGLEKWAEFRLPIRAVDEPRHTVTFGQARQAYGDEENPRYWIENAPEALDAPGERYLERQHGVVYYTPLPGEDMARAQVVAPALVQLVRFAGDVDAGRYVENIARLVKKLERTEIVQVGATPFLLESLSAKLDPNLQSLSSDSAGLGGSKWFGHG